MTGFGYLAKEGFKNVWNNRIMSIASVCVLISCLVLTGAAALFSLNVDKVVESVGKSNETSVYIKDGYSQLEAVYVGKAIEKLDNVESATFLSKEDAIKQYKSTLGDDLFAEMQGRNKLPDSFIVVMKDLSKYDDTVAQIKKIDGVDSISNHRELAKKLTDISNLVNMICIAVVCALTIISIFIIANTIRATMYSRRFEISIMKSVGATNSFVRWPFLIEGMIIGLISAIVSTGAIAILYETAQALVYQIVPIIPTEILKEEITMNKLKRILCAMLCVCMISIPMAIPTTVSAEDSISDLEQQLQQLEQENEKYQKILDDTKSDIAEKEEYKSALVSKVQVLDEKIAVTREKISSLNDDIKEKQDAYDKGLSEVEDQFDALANRLRILYMSGNATDLEIIFGAKDFSDLIDKMELVKSLANSDKELISEIQTKLDELSTKKESLEADKKDLETQQASLKSDQDEFNKLISDNDEILKNLYASNSEAQNSLESAALQSDEIEAKISQFGFIKLRFIICNCSVGFGLCMADTGLYISFITVERRQRNL